MAQEAVKTFLLIVAALFPIINPMGSGLAVVALLGSMAPASYARLAFRIALYALGLLIFALVTGSHVLAFFGISVPVLRVAGGVVIALTGWRLLNADNPSRKEAAQGARTTQTPHGTVPTADQEGMVFYPLTMPITVGPGAMAVAIALGSSTPRTGLSVGHVLGVMAALLFLTASIYLSVRWAAVLSRVLGTTGTQVAMRLLAFFILCIGFQLLWIGISELLQTLRAAP